MKRIIAIAAILVFVLGGVAVAADVAPTLADVMKAITELKADVAQLKGDGFTKANAAGALSTAKTTNGLVQIDVTSVMAGPDATVIAVKVINKTTDTDVAVNTLLSTKIVAGSQEVKIITTENFGDVLPGTSKTGLILAEPLPKDVKEVTLRTRLYNSKAYSTILEPTLKFNVAK